jgi:hypothetical protein
MLIDLTGLCFVMLLVGCLLVICCLTQGLAAYLMIARSKEAEKLPIPLTSQDWYERALEAANSLMDEIDPTIEISLIRRRVEDHKGAEFFCHAL